MAITLVAKTFSRLKHLWDAMEHDYREVQVFRENLFAHAKEFAGGNYASTGDDNDKPVNLLSLYVRIMDAHLVGSDPRMMISTFDRQIKPQVDALQEWGNRELVKMRFADVMRRAVLDALFLVGIVKISLTSPAESRFAGYGKQLGEPSLDNVDFEDFIFDTRAKKWEQCSYMGHRYRVLLEDVKESKLFDKKARLNVVSAEDEQVNPGGDERLSSITRSSSFNDSEFEEGVELWEIYIPRLNIVVTFDANGDHEEPLLVQDWVGPKCGPYIFLGFGQVPGQLIPKAPVMDLVNLDRSTNLLWRKLDNQASRQKNLWAYQNSEDAEKINGMEDGSFVQMTNPQGVVPLAGEGPNNIVSVWAAQEIELFSRLAGNLNALGGLAQQGDTATQERLISSNASHLVRSMGQHTVACAQECMKSLCWFWWNHPRLKIESEYKTVGSPRLKIQRTITPEDRIDKPFESLDVKIDPYSLTYDTPQSKMAIIDQIVKDILLPAFPAFGQPGVSELLETYVRMKAKFTNTPELIELLEKIIGVGGPPVDQAAAQKPGMPQETTRNYERTSRPGMSDQGQMQVLQQMMASGEQMNQQQLGQVG